MVFRNCRPLRNQKGASTTTGSTFLFTRPGTSPPLCWLPLSLPLSAESTAADLVQMRWPSAYIVLVVTSYARQSEFLLALPDYREGRQCPFFRQLVAKPVRIPPRQPAPGHARGLACRRPCPKDRRPRARPRWRRKLPWRSQLALQPHASIARTYREFPSVMPRSHGFVMCAKPKKPNGIYKGKTKGWLSHHFGRTTQLPHPSTLAQCVASTPSYCEMR